MVDFERKSDDAEKNSGNQWWNELLKKQENVEILKRKKIFIELLLKEEISGNFGQIFHILVRDPRIFLKHEKFLPNSKKSGNAKGNSGNSGNSVEFPAATLNLIWDEKIRKKVSETKISEQKLNELRSKLIVADEIHLDAEEESIIPIILLRHHSGIGWDLIIPGGWGREFWLAIYYATGHPIGVQETIHMHLENGEFGFPFLWPDSEAGNSWLVAEESKLLEKYRKRPPQKRINYRKLKISHPFSFPWAKLVFDWSGSDSWFVLRCRKILAKLQKAWKNKSWLNVVEILADHKNALIPVKLTSTGKGVPKAHAMICLPEKSDFETDEIGKL